MHPWDSSPVAYIDSNKLASAIESSLNRFVQGATLFDETLGVLNAWLGDIGLRLTHSDKGDWYLDGTNGFEVGNWPTFAQAFERTLNEAKRVIAEPAHRKD